MDSTLSPAGKDYSVSLSAANLYSILTAAPFVILLVGLYLAVWGYGSAIREIGSVLSDGERLFRGNILLLGILLVGTVLHELIHGITWLVAGRLPLSKIKLGIFWNSMTPYCHVKVPLPVQAYRLGAGMPGVITGMLPALLGVVVGNVWLLLLGSLFIFAAGGDLLILWLIRNVDSNKQVEDHPTRAGCYVLD